MSANASVSVVFSGKPLDPRFQIRNFQVMQGSGQHEMAILTVVVPNKAQVWNDTTPAFIRYGTYPKDMATFFGYVHHVEFNKKTGTAPQTADVVMVGTSMPMKNQSTKVWTNVSRSYIARSLATKYKLRSFVDTSDELLTVVQAGRSDFQLLSDLAAEIGYKFFVVGTTLYFRNPLAPLRHPSNSIRVFWQNGYLDDNCFSFTPIVGEMLTTDGGALANRTVSGIDPRTGALISAKNEMLRYSSFQDVRGRKASLNTVDTSTVIQTPQQAMAALQAEAALNKNWVSANARVQGFTNVTPLSAVGFDGSHIPYQNEGLWLVESASHVFVRDDESNSLVYGLDLQVTRDQIYTASFTSADFTNLQTQAQTVLQNNAWVSTGVGR